MSTANIPLKAARLGSLFLAFVFGVVALALGINADVKTNDTKDFVKANAPLSATVDINTDDVFKVGTVVVVVCGLLAIVSLIFLPLIATSKTYSTKSLPIQTSLFGFLTAWLFASLVPYTLFVATRSAKITATLPGGIPVPDSIIQSTQAALGVSPSYKDTPTLRNAVVLAWIAFLFGLTSTFISFLAQRRAKTGYVAQESAPSTAEPINEKEEKKASSEVEQTAV
ncbi:hypothetical protein QCA50_004904 [Cerrena zonata]|uniref:MARVEL domain-containing protein n=1 Tax=Cerrena zonata TaxID=2478898 RepID=A0AAW0GK68_9APHY